jgi:hypothetical protein
MVVNVCFDRLEFKICRTLLKIMQAHLEQREWGDGSEGEDTDFDRWIHGQVCQSEYNLM